MEVDVFEALLDVVAGSLELVVLVFVVEVVVGFLVELLVFVLDFELVVEVADVPRME